MSIADKLTVIAENVPKVYRAGASDFGLVGSAEGEVVTFENVHPKEHMVKAKISSKNLWDPNKTDFSDVKVTASGKNLIPYPYQDATKTINGITFTDNGDGTITANGTAIANAVFNIANKPTEVWDGIETDGTYTASLGFDGNYSANSVDFIANYFPQGSSTAARWLVAHLGKTETMECPVDIVGMRVYLIVYSGATVENLTLKPQIEYGTTATEYEPHKPSAEYTANADGTVSGVRSISPTMRLYADGEGIMVSAECFLDPKAIREELTNAILTLGGEI